MMPPDWADPIPGLPEFFDECPRCDGSRVEPNGGTPCVKCYGIGTVLTEAGRAVAAVQEWRETAQARRIRPALTRVSLGLGAPPEPSAQPINEVTPFMDPNS